MKVYSDKKVDRKTDKTDKTSKKKQKTHKVKRGETLGEIAENTVSDFQNLKKPTASRATTSRLDSR